MRPRRLVRIVAFFGIATTVFVGGISSANRPFAPAASASTSSVAAPHAAAHAGGPAAATRSDDLSFRLPQLAGSLLSPNARNLAMRSTTSGPLLLFLPATRAVPRDYRNFLEAAEAAGYHVLALDYWNLGRSVAQTCGKVPSCYGNVQANRFDGTHASRFSAIAPADSIRARLVRALTLLSTRDPQGGWGSYLAGEHIRWNRIVVAGHSQGGGESAYIGHRYLVQGVLMFASPVASDGQVVASWLTRAGKTPSSRYYGFDARGDVYYHRIQGSWTALQVGGAAPNTLVTDSVPFGGSHRLVTTLPLGSPGQAHSRMVTDNGPRTAAGIPVFRPIWQWMLHAVRAPAPVVATPRVPIPVPAV